MIRHACLALAALVVLASCRSSENADPFTPSTVQAESLLGEPLRSPVFAATEYARLADALSAARADLAANPGDEMATIWVGRRLAYLGSYREAVATFTDGLVRHPRSHKLLRHRGHRWITLREFDRAVDDLSRAAELARDLPDEVEPDGAPNAAGIPVSSTWSNIQYHLGLAHYLRGEYDLAHDAFAASRDTPLTNADKVVSAGHWQWQCLQRLGRTDEARALIDSIPVDLEVIENMSYRDLIELYRSGPPSGVASSSDVGSDPSGAAFAYGRAGWLRAHGETEAADALLQQIIDDTGWASFGHIAAEVDLSRAR